MYLLPPIRIWDAGGNRICKVRDIFLAERQATKGSIPLLKK